MLNIQTKEKTEASHNVQTSEEMTLCFCFMHGPANRHSHTEIALLYGVNMNSVC